MQSLDNISFLSPDFQDETFTLCIRIKITDSQLNEKSIKVCRTCQNKGVITERAAVVFLLDEVEVSMLLSGLLCLGDTLNLFF